MNGNFILIIITIFLLCNQCKSAPMDYDDLKAEESVLLKRKELSEKYWATVKEVIISIFTALGFILDMIKIKALVPIIYLLNLLDKRFNIVNLVLFIFQKCNKPKEQVTVV